MNQRDPEHPIQTVSLSIPSIPRFLRIVRSLIAELAELNGFSLKDRDRICLAVGEACSNIIRHSYKGKPDEIIVIKCELHEDRIKISIRDFGEKIDLSRIRPPDAASVQPGGLGVHMIRCMMDEVEYETTHEVGNEIHMTKLLSSAEHDNGG
ncbi:MAG: ATP-binding protein [Candidatus Abyssobacteria bacterium SURF_5]|uniref:ATP-binding protein n=1 Tax=Abyssobacteria bacterium (strain SURF_5) TaxID=2093360 RepID=A0A3A4N7J4_ABYX5|nr:MAG: ATP-binding protein [Candidatus Abyssubacteria bacterium SURF_5]